MNFLPGEPYHVYNRGNNRERTFFTRENYLYFLRKVRKEWQQWADIVSFSIMPNHFHFILIPKAAGCEYILIKEKELHLQKLSKAIGKTLSSYTRAINIQQNKSGSLFQKKTKAKPLFNSDGENYLEHCVGYIHNNAFVAGLVKDPYDWEFSSLIDYANLRAGTLCNKDWLFRNIDFAFEFKKENISNRKWPVEVF